MSQPPNPDLQVQERAVTIESPWVVIPEVKPGSTTTVSSGAWADTRFVTEVQPKETLPDIEPEERSDPKHPQYEAGTTVDGEHVGGQFMPKDGAGATDGTADAPPAWQVLSDEAHNIQERLLNGAVENVKMLQQVASVDAGIHSYECSVADVGGQKAFIKASYDANREYAAVLINQMLGNYVNMPVGAYRPLPEGAVPGEEPGRMAMFSEFIEGGSGHSHAMDRTEMRRIALFDAVIGNCDRHPGNVRIDTHGNMYAIDNGIAFRDHGLNEALIRSYGHPKDWRAVEPIPLSAAGRDALTLFKKNMPSARKQLEGLLTPAELTAMEARVEAMLDKDTILLRYEQDGGGS
jgi:hypothetical protein